MSRSVMICLLVSAVAVFSQQVNSQQRPDLDLHQRIKRGDFYGPNGLGAGNGGLGGYGGTYGGLGLTGSSFNPVLFQGAAVAGGFAKEAYNANLASLASADGLLSGGSFGVGYYAGAVANAAAAGAAAGNKHKGGSSLSYGRR
ncbi:glycine-rich cell wall structural protein 2-like [Daphnia pulex]|uniref:glycine-rich cell wall structural protein 2-like n=2 Tax=Daphnia TaxID=6668 RepID=UPI001EDCA910|nr:glycine-rich cell wall structural protein 2-like [Daphnia pulex]